VVADDWMPRLPNLVVGANEEDHHYTGANFGRDYRADILADIVYAEEGDPCPECGRPLSLSRAVEVGNIFKLGSRYSQAMGCLYHDEEGGSRPVVMGSYGIGLGRLLACVAEEHHDDQGLCWPPSLAPFDVHLVGLCRDPEPCDDLYESLIGAGLSVLFDDRSERAGVKFNDADLMGVPVRLTLGDRSLSRREVEMKLRREAERLSLPIDEAAHRSRAELDRIQREIESGLEA
jgi:prolyl-tRNA synthetase